MPSTTTLKFDLERLMKNARVRLPGALDDSIKLEMFEVFREFFTDSGVWREEIEFDTVVGVTEYVIEPDAGLGAMIDLISLKDDKELNVKATMAIPGTIVLKDEPSLVNTLTATVSLTVTDPNTRDWMPQLPDHICIRYFTGLLDGILGRMYSQPAKAYTNERMSIYHLRRFRDTIARAKVQANKKNLYNAQVWRYPVFA